MKQSHSLDMLPLVRGASLLYQQRDDYGVAIAAVIVCRTLIGDSLRTTPPIPRIMTSTTEPSKDRGGGLDKMESGTLICGIVTNNGRNEKILGVIPMHGVNVVFQLEAGGQSHEGAARKNSVHP